MSSELASGATPRILLREEKVDSMESWNATDTVMPWRARSSLMHTQMLAASWLLLAAGHACPDHDL